MAKRNFIKSAASGVEKICRGVANAGRRIGARRTLFIWSAASAAIALYFGIAESIGMYGANFILDMNTFVMLRFLEIISIFLKLFVPAFMLVAAMKYIFDAKNITSRASETLKLSLFAALIVGLGIGAFYYLNAGHMVGENASAYCAEGARCLFGWKMLRFAGEAALGSFLGSLVIFLGMRGIYSELSYMFKKK